MVSYLTDNKVVTNKMTPDHAAYLTDNGVTLRIK
jgi:hypothetical protein